MVSGNGTICLISKCPFGLLNGRGWDSSPYIELILEVLSFASLPNDPNILWNDQKRYMALGGAGAWRVLELLLHNISYEVWISIGAHRLSWNHYYQRSSQMGKLSVEILDSVVNYLLQSAARPMYVSLNLLVFPPMLTHFDFISCCWR